MSRKGFTALLMSLGLASILVLPAFAQDTTPEATPVVTAVSTAASTPEATAVTTAEATATSTAMVTSEATETSTEAATETATVAPTVMVTSEATAVSTAEATAASTMTVPANAILSSLNDPRGISYDSAGNLYVAEAGSAGPILVAHDPDNGDTFAGVSSKITEFSAASTESAPVPFMISGGAPGGEITGATDVIATDTSIWVAISSLLPQDPFSDAVVEIDRATGSVKTYISPAVNEATNNPDGAEINSNVNAIALGPDGTLYIVDTGANTIYTWTQADGLKVFHVWKDDSVPTSLAFASDGSFYVGFLGQGIAPGAGKVEHWSADGQTLTETFSNLTAVTDVAVGKDGSVYAVELVTGFGAQGPAINSGAVIKVSSSGNTPIAQNLPQPYSIAQAPDGSWSVSVGAVFNPVDSGAVIKIG